MSAVTSEINRSCSDEYENVVNQNRHNKKEQNHFRKNIKIMRMVILKNLSFCEIGDYSKFK